MRTTGANPKAFLEWKMGDNVLMEGNIFTGWPSALAINSVNQDGRTPWCVVKNFTFRNNWMTNFSVALSYSGGAPDTTPGGPAHLSEAATNINFLNNLFTQHNDKAGDVGTTKIGTMGGGVGVTIEHNTWVMKSTHDGGALSGTVVMGDLTFKDNIFYYSRYGFQGGVFWIYGRGE